MNEYETIRDNIMAHTITPAHEANGQGMGNSRETTAYLNRRGGNVLALLAMAFSGALVGFVVGVLVGGMW